MSAITVSTLAFQDHLDQLAHKGLREKEVPQAPLVQLDQLDLLDLLERLEREVRQENQD